MTARRVTILACDGHECSERFTCAAERFDETRYTAATLAGWSFVLGAGKAFERGPRFSQDLCAACTKVRAIEARPL